MIDQDVLERVLAAAVRTGAEFAEVYAEDKRSTSVGLDDGRVEQVTSGRDRGAGIRVVKGDTTGFAHTADLSEAGLREAAEAAAAAASQGGGGARTIALTRGAQRVVSPVSQFPDDVRKADKVAVLQRMDDAARSAGAAIVQVSAGYGDSRKHILVANTDGVFVTDQQVRTLLRITAVADGDGGMQTGSQSAGQTMGFELIGHVDVEALARDAARQALTKLNARPAPSGALPVVIKRGSGGVLFHEACGHGLEADLVAKGGSVELNDFGVMACGAPTINFSAHRFTTMDLDAARHPYELTAQPTITLHLDYAQNGLGSASCGPGVAAPYQLHAEPFAFSVTLRAVQAGIDEVAQLGREAIHDH